MRDKQREETRRRLYHAALEVFTRDGVDACRVEDIAQLAGVSRAAFYFHFPSKDDVLLELLRESEAPVVDAVLALPPSATLQQVFDALVHTMTSFWTHGERRKLTIDVFNVSMRRAAIAHDREAEVVRAAVGKRFVTAAARGELSPMVPAEALADFYLLNCMAALSTWSATTPMPLEDMLRGMTFLFMSGAKGPAAE